VPNTLEARYSESLLQSGDWWKEEDLPPDWDALLPGGPLWVDVGFGQGEFLLAAAAAHPDRRFVGIDRFREGHRKLLKACRESRLDNLASLVGNAFVLLNLGFANASLEAVSVNFPDPWPKARHAHNRLYQTELFAIIARKLLPGGTLYLATDSRPNAEQAVAELAPVEALRSTHPYRPWLDRSPHPVTTRYEAKWIAEGRDLHYLVYTKKMMDEG
jgi:tRNA (guanine-N7-)-methyltransferase